MYSRDISSCVNGLVVGVVLEAEEEYLNDFSYICGNFHSINYADRKEITSLWQAIFGYSAATGNVTR